MSGSSRDEALKSGLLGIPPHFSSITWKCRIPNPVLIFSTQTFAIRHTKVVGALTRLTLIGQRLTEFDLIRSAPPAMIYEFVYSAFIPPTKQKLSETLPLLIFASSSLPPPANSLHRTCIEASGYVNREAGHAWEDKSHCWRE